MPLVELSERELKYLATMNAQNIFVIKHMAKKNNTVFPDMPMAEAIQTKLEPLLPEGVPDPFSTPAVAQTKSEKAGLGKRRKKR